MLFTAPHAGKQRSPHAPGQNLFPQPWAFPCLPEPIKGLGFGLSCPVRGRHATWTRRAARVLLTCRSALSRLCIVNLVRACGCKRTCGPCAPVCVPARVPEHACVRAWQDACLQALLRARGALVKGLGLLQREPGCSNVFLLRLIQDFGVLELSGLNKASYHAST